MELYIRAHVNAMAYSNTLSHASSSALKQYIVAVFFFVCGCVLQCVRVPRRKSVILCKTQSADGD